MTERKKNQRWICSLNLKQQKWPPTREEEAEEENISSHIQGCLPKMFDQAWPGASVVSSLEKESLFAAILIPVSIRCQWNVKSVSFLCWTTCLLLGKNTAEISACCKFHTFILLVESSLKVKVQEEQSNSSRSQKY